MLRSTTHMALARLASTVLCIMSTAVLLIMVIMDKPFSSRSVRNAQPDLLPSWLEITSKFHRLFTSTSVDRLQWHLFFLTPLLNFSKLFDVQVTEVHGELNAHVRLLLEVSYT